MIIAAHTLTLRPNYDHIHLQYMAVGVDDWLVADSEDEGAFAQLPPVTRFAATGNLTLFDCKLHCRTDVYHLMTTVYYSVSDSDGCLLYG